MKILRNTEWVFEGYSANFPVLEGPAFIFRNFRYGDVVALKVAKYIDATSDVVYYFDASRNYVGASNVKGSIDYTSTPALKRCAR